MRVRAVNTADGFSIAGKQHVAEASAEIVRSAMASQEAIAPLVGNTRPGPAKIGLEKTDCASGCTYWGFGVGQICFTLRCFYTADAFSAFKSFSIRSNAFL